MSENDKKERTHKSNIINQTHHGKERNLEQGIASNHHGANGDSNHLRGDIVHGHVNRMYTHLCPTIGALEENESGIGLRWGYETYPHPEKCLSNKKKVARTFRATNKKG